MTPAVPMDVGFVGLGRMGLPMATNILRQGHRLTVWNRSPDRAASLVAAGARLVARPEDAARGALVMTMVADDAALEAVVYGAGGICNGSALHVSHSTIGVALADRLTADAGPAGFVSAPVFGRPAAAERAELFVVAAGAANHLITLGPVFAAIGQRTFLVSDRPAAANAVKLGGNLMLVAAVQAFAEAMVVAERYGVERQALFDVMTGTLFGSAVHRGYGQLMADDHLKPAGFSVAQAAKDVGLARAAAAGVGARLPSAAVLLAQLELLAASEGSDVDCAALRRVAD